MDVGGEAEAKRAKDWVVILGDYFLKPSCYKTKGPEKAHIPLTPTPGGKPALELEYKRSRDRSRNRYKTQSELSSTLIMAILTV